MNTGERKHKLNPFKTLCLILYGDYEFMNHHESKVIVKIGPFARLLRVKNDRLKEYLDWLHRHHYINHLTYDWGVASFNVNKPKIWRHDV